jgi:hypothetical protein
MNLITLVIFPVQKKKPKSWKEILIMSEIEWVKTTIDRKFKLEVCHARWESMF